MPSAAHALLIISLETNLKTTFLTFASASQEKCRLPPIQLPAEPPARKILWLTKTTFASATFQPLQAQQMDLVPVLTPMPLFLTDTVCVI